MHVDISATWLAALGGHFAVRGISREGVVHWGLFFASGYGGEGGKSELLGHLTTNRRTCLPFHYFATVCFAGIVAQGVRLFDL